MVALPNQTRIHFKNRVWPRSIGDGFQSLHPNGRRLQVHFEPFDQPLTNHHWPLWDCYTAYLAAIKQCQRIRGSENRGLLSLQYRMWLKVWVFVWMCVNLTFGSEVERLLSHTQQKEDVNLKSKAKGVKNYSNQTLWVWYTDVFLFGDGRYQSYVVATGVGNVCNSLVSW